MLLFCSSKDKSSYIRIGLRLGMTLEPMNALLEIAGFDPVGIIDDQARSGNARAQFLLIRMLSEWDQQHPEQRKWRSTVDPAQLPETTVKAALHQMLGLAEEDAGLLRDMERAWSEVSFGESFPFSMEMEDI